MKWIGPLFINAGGWSAYVSYENGVWYVDKSEPIEIVEGRAGVKLLPILQNDYGGGYLHQIELIREGLTYHSLDPALAETFPFHIPVLTAFRNMFGWAKFAADWVQYIDMNNDMAQLLFDACKNKSIDQSSRHKVLRVVNGWAKRNGFTFVRRKS